MADWLLWLVVVKCLSSENEKESRNIGVTVIVDQTALCLNAACNEAIRAVAVPVVMSTPCVCT